MIMRRCSSDENRRIKRINAQVVEQRETQSKNQEAQSDEMREYVVENEFVKAVRAAGGVAYKLTSQTANGLPDRLVLFFPAKTVFVELKAPGKMLRPLQRKRRYQLMKLGFPVLCIDRLSQIKPCIQAILDWTPGEPFPDNIGAKVPDLDLATLPADQGSLDDLDDYGIKLEPEDPSVLANFRNLDQPQQDRQSRPR